MPNSQLTAGLIEALKNSIKTREDLKTHLPDLTLCKERPWAIYKTAELLMEEHTYKTYEDNEEMTVYNDGIYHSNAQNRVKADIENTWQKEGNTHIVAEIINHMKRQTYTKREMFNLPEYIAVKNGLIDVKTGIVHPFNPQKLYTYTLPIEYSPEAKCPQIDKFLSEVLKPDDIIIAYEIIGYCLWHGYPIHKAIMLHGGGSNGKSTFINLLKSFLGNDNTSSVSLQELCDGEYSSGWLYGKLANMYADLEDKSLKSTGRFKILTGADTITTNVKYGQPITFTNCAKMIFSANKIPATYDDTDAFYRRWVILHFARTFTDKEANKNLINDLTTPEELSGLLNESLKALKGVLDRGYFSSSKTTEELREEYTRLSDPIGAFILDCVIQGDLNDETIRTKKEEIFHAYINYCKDRRLSRKNEVWFWKDFRNRVICSFYKHGKTGIQYVNGISLVFSSLEPKREQYTINNEQYTMDNQGNQGKQGKSLLVNSVEKITEKDNEKIPCLPFLPCLEKPMDFKISVLEFLHNFDEGIGVERLELEILGSVDYQLSKEEIRVILDRLKSDGRIFEVSEGKYKINQ